MAIGTEEIIINGAFRLLDRGGYEMVDLVKIREEYGLSEESINKYFTNNNELIARLATIELDKLFDKFQIVNDINSFSSLIEFMNNFLDWARSKPYRYFMVFRKWPNITENLAKLSIKSRETFISIFCKYFSRPVKGIKAEKFAFIFWSLCTGGISLELMGHLNDENDDPKTTPEEMINIIIDLLRS